MNNMTIGLSLKNHSKWDKIHLNREIVNSWYTIDRKEDIVI